jgi:hemoglobin/transferrin/lactoferrin receptor protein
MSHDSSGTHKFIAWLGIPALLNSLPASALDPLPELEMVTVVGKIAQPLSEVAAMVSVITAEDLQLWLAFDPADVFRNQPGVSVRRDPNRFGYTAITVRGLSGNRVLLETDGVPAPNTFSIGNFSDAGRQFADPELIRRIEILKGPASTLYGSDAIAGVVATTTMDPADLLQDDADQALRLRSGYTSDSHAAMAGVTAAARFETFDGMLSFTRREGSEMQNAYRVVDANPRDFEADSVLGRVVIHGLGGSLRLTMGWDRQAALTDVDSLELSSGRFANTTFLQGDDSVEGLRFIVDQVLDDPGAFELLEWRVYLLQTRFSQVTNEERRPVPPATPPLAIQRDFRYEETVAGGELTVARRIDGDHGAHRLVGGLELARTHVVEQRNGLQTNLTTGATTNVILGEVLPVRDFPISDLSKAGLYFQDEWRPHEGRWTLIPALRADWYRLEPAVDAMYVADNPTQSPVSIDQWSLAPKFGASYTVSDDLMMFLQYSHGFRSQPFEDVNIGLDLPQFNIRAIPNPDLEPEKSDSLEIGARFSGGAVTGSASVYYSRYRDFIESKVNIGRDPATGTTLFQSQNIGKAEIHGAEATFEFDLGAWIEALPGLSGSLSVAWTRGEDVVRDLPINTIDPARGTIGLRYAAPSSRWMAQLALTAVDGVDRVDDSRSPLYQPSGFMTIDLTGQWRISDRWRLNAGIFNLADRSYYEWADVRGRIPDDPLLELFRQPGRNVSLTLTAMF